MGSKSQDLTVLFLFFGDRSKEVSIPQSLECNRKQSLEPVPLLIVDSIAF